MAPESTEVIENSPPQDTSGQKGQHKSKGGDKGRRGGGGGGASRQVIVSKALSKILRHDAEKFGLKLDAAGFVNVKDLLQSNRIRSTHVTFQEVQEAAANNEKQRFTIKLDPQYATTSPESKDDAPPVLDFAADSDPSHYLIRANQGHSIALDSAAHLIPITPEAGNIPPNVIHGTFFANWPLILATGGLKRMGRNHIHFSQGLPEDGVISGMRRDAQVLIHIDIRKSIEGGTKWWLSDNGVVLTEGHPETGLVGTDVWTKVEGRKEDVGTLWENGEVKKDLPEWAQKMKAPTEKRAIVDRTRKVEKEKGGKLKMSEVPEIVLEKEKTGAVEEPAVGI